VEGLEQEEELRFEDVEAGFIPEHVIGTFHLGPDGKLSVEPLLDLVIGPSPVPEPAPLSGRGTGNADDSVELGVGIGFEQERDHHHGEGAFLRAPLVDLGLPNGSDAGMQDCFELASSQLIGEDDLGEVLPAQVSVGCEARRTEREADFVKCWLTWSNEIAGDRVGIGDRHALCDEELGDSGFAHPDPASEAEKLHDRPDAERRGQRGIPTVGMWGMRCDWLQGDQGIALQSLWITPQGLTAR
jgi:hypothetical protein